jgi:hypothetical protein
MGHILQKRSFACPAHTQNAHGLRLPPPNDLKKAGDLFMTAVKIGRIFDWMSNNVRHKNTAPPE